MSPFDQVIPANQRTQGNKGQKHIGLPRDSTRHEGEGWTRDRTDCLKVTVHFLVRPISLIFASSLLVSQILMTP